MGSNPTPSARWFNLVGHVPDPWDMPYKDRERQRAASRAHYHANKEAYADRRRIHMAEHRRNLKLRVIAYLNEHPCVDCKEGDPVVLTFDHVRGKKLGNIGTLIANGKSWKIVEAEIRKCDVRCANCHARRTAKQFGWLKAVSLV